MQKFLIRSSPIDTTLRPHAIVPGLYTAEEAIDDQMAQDLLKSIDSHDWDTTLKRRVQHYGYKYDPKLKGICSNNKTEDMPKWVWPLCESLMEKGFIEKYPNQLIVNEYKEGQGISKHVDSDVFGDVIFSVSLGIACNVIFKRAEQTVVLSLHPRMFMKMEAEARYMWTHEMSILNCGRRVSLTFRYV